MLITLLALAIAIASLPTPKAQSLDAAATTDAPQLQGDSGRGVTPRQLEKRAVTNPGFGYGAINGPYTWPKIFPTCRGDRQSPINIDLRESKSLPADVDDALFFKYYDASPSQLIVANNGHTLKMLGSWSTQRTPRISGYVLSGEYAFAEVHFHWGSDNIHGSEHLIHGYRYPLEMHFVHYKMSYGSLQNALTKNDGLAVVGYMFQVQGERNPGLSMLLEASKSVIDPKLPNVTVTPFTLDKLAPPFTRNYVSYLGSLTIPPCSEIVTWIVSLEPQCVSSDQLAEFHTLQREDGTKIQSNFRPVQPLNGRKIYYIP